MLDGEDQLRAAILANVVLEDPEQNAIAGVSAVILDVRWAVFNRLTKDGTDALVASVLATRAATVVMHRYLHGVFVHEIAVMLDVTERTVERDLALVRSSWDGVLDESATPRLAA